MKNKSTEGMITVYRCRKCNQTKYLDSFHKNKRQANGHHYYCKECVSEYLHNRYMSEDGRAKIVDYRKKYNQTEAYREKRKAYKASSLLNNKQKHLIRWQTENDLRSGNIKKTPCIKCGEIKVEAHHYDYEHKSHFIWVCKKCHLKEHGKGKSPSGIFAKRVTVDWDTVDIGTEYKGGAGKISGVCSVAWCQEESHSIGLCKHHAHQYWRYKRKEKNETKQYR